MEAKMGCHKGLRASAAVIKASYQPMIIREELLTYMATRFEWKIWESRYRWGFSVRQPRVQEVLVIELLLLRIKRFRDQLRLPPFGGEGQTCWKPWGETQSKLERLNLPACVRSPGRNLRNLLEKASEQLNGTCHCDQEKWLEHGRMDGQ